MKDKQKILDEILECGIVAIVRAESAELALKGFQAALKGGVKVIEVTFTVPNVLDVIKKLSQEIGDDVILGAGTVLSPAAAYDAVDAGARFIVSPNTNIATIKAAQERKVPVFPGALTPTEVLTAWQAGADIIKIFPANVMGQGYLKDLHGPFPDIPLMPTGGVDLNTAKGWLEAGAVALGVGGALVDKKLLASGNFDEITDRARKFKDIVNEYRNNK